jgi:hypothetical protein
LNFNAYKVIMVFLILFRPIFEELHHNTVGTLEEKKISPETLARGPAAARPPRFRAAAGRVRWKRPRPPGGRMSLTFPVLAVTVLGRFGQGRAASLCGVGEPAGC